MNRLIQQKETSGLLKDKLAAPLSPRGCASESCSKPLSHHGSSKKNALRGAQMRQRRWRLIWSIEKQI